MKISQRHLAAIVLVLLVSLPSFAQGGREMQRFSQGGVSFQYPAAWTLSDKSTADNQHLVLELKGTAAQIMILVERVPSTKPGERGEALRTRTTLFADLMTRELEKVGATVQRSEVTTDVGGVQADGLRLRASPGNQPGSVEVYSFVLGGRIVMLTLLRPDTDAPAATPAWTAVRSSLRVGASTAAAPTPGTPLITAPAVSEPTAKFVGLDYGTVTGSAYTNKFFGFRLTIPFGWRVQERATREMILERGREEMKTNNAQTNARMNESLSNTVNLLTVFKYDIGTSVDFNASLICGAEWLQNSPMTASQYIDGSRRALQLSGKEYSFRSQGKETVGGQEFSVMEVEMPMSVKQKYYAAVKRNYALFFILTYVTEEDEAILKQALRSVRFS